MYELAYPYSAFKNDNDAYETALIFVLIISKYGVPYIGSSFSYSLSFAG